jgi:hypothetical protein
MRDARMLSDAKLRCFYVHDAMLRLEKFICFVANGIAAAYNRLTR